MLQGAYAVAPLLLVVRARVSRARHTSSAAFNPTDRAVLATVAWTVLDRRIENRDAARRVERYQEHPVED